MTKDKVGAEPKNKRVRHYYDKMQSFHIGVSRDEWCCYRSSKFPFFAINGYFLSLGDGCAKRCSIELIEKHWDNDAIGTIGYKYYIFGVVDRKRKIAVIRCNYCYSWNLEKSLPDDFKIYHVMDFPVFNITAPRNRKTLLKEYAKYLVHTYMQIRYQEFKVLNSNSKILHKRISNRSIENVIRNLKDISNKVPTKTSLFGKNNVFTSFSNGEVKFPTIDDILNDTVFNEEEKEYLDKCIFYTKYVYNKNNLYCWNDIVNNWNKVVNEEVLWQDDIINKEKAKKEALIKTFKQYRKKVGEDLQVKIKEFVANLGGDNIIDCWRKNNLHYNLIPYKDCKIVNDTIEWYDAYHVIDKCFDNIQLKLKGNNVVTSKGAVVPLIEAIKLFNTLYIKYFINKDTESVLFSSHIKVGYYTLRFIKYKEKVTDCGKSLGYKEWLIQIGCHALWFDDVKDFARYYNLQDKLTFPLDKTTQECRDNKLINIINSHDTK